MHRNPNPQVRHGAQAGYILVLTVVMLALLTVAASFIAQRVALEQGQMRDERDASEGEFRLQSARAKVLWTLSTAGRVTGGLGVGNGLLKCDGRWYDVGEGVAVSIQDSRGLINIARASDEVKNRFLGTFNLGASQITHLIDTLNDYQDSDILVRLQGAEASQYASVGLPPPRNAPLQVPMELARVLDWPAAAPLWGKDSLWDHVYVWSESFINPNTATWRTLVAVFGLPAEDAKRLVAARTAGSIDLYQMLAGDLDPFISPFSPVESRAFVLTLVVRGRPAAYREFVVFTPQASEGPWRTSYVNDYPAVREALPETLPPFPGTGVRPDDGAQSGPSAGVPLNQESHLPF